MTGRARAYRLNGRGVAEPQRPLAGPPMRRAVMPMGRRAFLGAVAAASLCSAARPDATALQVLFIGNSFTLQHDLPGLFADLAWQAGREIGVFVHARNGAFLSEHLAEHSPKEIFDAQGIDGAQPLLIVLQDHSTAALTQETRALSKAAFLRFQSLKVQMLIFPPWPRREGHALYSRPGMPRSPAEMSDRIRRHSSGLLWMLDALNRPRAFYAPVPQAWMLGTGLDLHDRDGYHANLSGAWLTALVLALSAGLAPKAPVAPDGVRWPSRLTHIARMASS